MHHADFYLCEIYSRFRLGTFQLAEVVSQLTEFSENTVQHFSSHQVIGLLKIYK
jgi:hypothetical protein